MAPLVLSAYCLGTPVAVCHVVCNVAKPQRASRTEARYAQYDPTQTRQGASTVWWLDAQASVCLGSYASHATASGATRADASDLPPPPHGRHLHALLSPCRLCVSRLAGMGQSARQRASQWRPLETIPLYRLPRVLSGASWHALSWQAGLRGAAWPCVGVLGRG